MKLFKQITCKKETHWVQSTHTFTITSTPLREFRVTLCCVAYLNLFIKIVSITLIQKVGANFSSIHSIQKRVLYGVHVPVSTSTTTSFNHATYKSEFIFHAISANWMQIPESTVSCFYFLLIKCNLFSSKHRSDVSTR